MTKKRGRARVRTASCASTPRTLARIRQGDGLPCLRPICASQYLQHAEVFKPDQRPRKPQRVRAEFGLLEGYLSILAVASISGHRRSHAPLPLLARPLLAELPDRDRPRPQTGGRGVAGLYMVLVSTIQAGPGDRAGCSRRGRGISSVFLIPNKWPGGNSRPCIYRGSYRVCNRGIGCGGLSRRLLSLAPHVAPSSSPPRHPAHHVISK